MNASKIESCRPMKKLETLSISFENLDHVVIPAKYIIDMTICGIQKSSGITCQLPLIKISGLYLKLNKLS